MLPYSRHIAIVTIETGGQLVNGEWVEGLKQELTIKGRYVPANGMNKDNYVIKNKDGDEITYKGMFMTLSAVNKDAVRILVESKGIESKIINWYPYDSHTVIYI